MTDEPKKIHLEPHPPAGTSRATTRHRVEVLCETPPPQAGGTLTAQIECGAAVVRIYAHADDPSHGHSVTIARKTPAGTTPESARLSTHDLADLRRALAHVPEVAGSGVGDGIARRLREDRWRTREEKPSDARRTR